MKSNAEWKYWGERDPLYAVASWPGKERSSKDAWTNEEFYNLGQQDWADFLRQWQGYGFKAGTCIEIGCGAGRMTNQLRQTFSKVEAFDVSQHQIDYARKNIPAENVNFTLTEGIKLPLADNTCDAAFSVHVFQHFESHADAYAVFAELFRSLAPGGTIMVHLPVYDLPAKKISNLFRPVISLSQWYHDIKASLDRKLQNGGWKNLPFERRDLFSALAKIGFSDLEFRIFYTQSNHDEHGFVFARKPV